LNKIGKTRYHQRKRHATRGNKSTPINHTEVWIKRMRTSSTCCHRYLLRRASRPRTTL